MLFYKLNQLKGIFNTITNKLSMFFFLISHLKFGSEQEVNFLSDLADRCFLFAFQLEMNIDIDAQ